eukprot:scaffold23045_cov74-Phaeocystis_antarctica.AAC.5
MPICAMPRDSAWQSAASHCCTPASTYDALLRPSNADSMPEVSISSPTTLKSHRSIWPGLPPPPLPAPVPGCTAAATTSVTQHALERHDRSEEHVHRVKVALRRVEGRQWQVVNCQLSVYCTVSAGSAAEGLSQPGGAPFTHQEGDGVGGGGGGGGGGEGGGLSGDGAD